MLCSLVILSALVATITGQDSRIYTIAVGHDWGAHEYMLVIY